MPGLYDLVWVNLSNMDHQEPRPLARQIGLGSGIAVVVGSTIGSGIFKSPAGIATQLPGPLPMMLAWIVGGIIVLCGALSLAEVGSAYPFSGGIYVYMREAFGKTVAFLFGWAQLVLIRPSGIGALSIVFGQYALASTGTTDSNLNYPYYVAALAVLAIIITGAANIFGVRLGTAIQNYTTIAKTAGLVILILLALTVGLSKSGGHFSPTLPTGSFSWSAFGIALVSVFWAYDGWADGSLVGGEIVNPKRNIPRAIITGTLLVIAVYVFANIAYLSIFNVDQIAKSPIIAADTMSALVGNWGKTFIVICVMVSVFGTLNGTLLTSPRVFFALGEDGLFPRKLSEVHPKFNTPYLAISLASGLGVLYVVIATLMTGNKAFGSLTDAFVIGMVPFYALSVGSIFIFRKRSREDYEPTSRSPLFPLTPIVFIVATLMTLVASLLDEATRAPTIITLGLIALGIPIFKLLPAGRSKH
jgi:basic amino acid/polyamine antiporter, APA family